MLIDAGASFKSYSSDITRTVPAKGRFSTAQAQAYDLVHRALKKCTQKAKPGASFQTLQKEACRILTDGLLELGILKGSFEKLMEARAYQNFFMHGIGHPMGLDVHDVVEFDYSKPFKPKRKDTLKAGQVITIEPGLYFDPKDKSVPAEFRGIGIRIEDDILITENGPEVLSHNIPSRREEIEELMLGS